MRGRAVGLLTASLALLALVWADWLLDPTAPRGPAFPVALSAVLAANVPLTLAGSRLKRAVVARVQRYLINPPVRLLLRLGVMPLGYALLETRGRVSGRPRTTPVGNGREGDTFWIVAEHGERAGYVPTSAAAPRCGSASARACASPGTVEPPTSCPKTTPTPASAASAAGTRCGRSTRWWCG
ncbi:nitroreductase/quinone reductase family protein [Streptomyces sp. NPDC001410]|uniref:nitroreductase/quinone reductase family protein n=1 Tax=Streptomyces sp. NPDC001410 TaxID=3364574 RepID=UPI003689CABA